jgi:hypothetical protein
MSEPKNEQLRKIQKHEIVISLESVGENSRIDTQRVVDSISKGLSEQFNIIDVKAYSQRD